MSTTRLVPGTFVTSRTEGIKRVTPKRGVVHGDNPVLYEMLPDIDVAFIIYVEPDVAWRPETLVMVGGILGWIDARKLCPV